MGDRVAIQDPEETELKRQLEKVDWGRFLQYGTIEILVQAGKPTTVTKKEIRKLR